MNEEDTIKSIVKLLDGKSKSDCKRILQYVIEKLDDFCVANITLASTVLFPGQP
jgi:hypothetical protein